MAVGKAQPSKVGLPFIQADAFQCGFCTSGQVMSLRALLDTHPEPTDDQILRAVTENRTGLDQYASSQSERPYSQTRNASNAVCSVSSGRAASHAPAARKEATVIVS